jgi:hypothetical protein
MSDSGDDAVRFLKISSELEGNNDESENQSHQFEI